MNLLLTGGAVFLNGSFQNMDLAIDQGRIVSSSLPKEGFSVIELHNRLIVPGFVDVHVHLREPGFSYKETIKRLCNLMTEKPSLGREGETETIRPWSMAMSIF